MTAEQFLRQAKNFAGTAYVAFELEDKVMAVGRLRKDGPIHLYERDRLAEGQGGLRRPLATFEGVSEAAVAGALIASLGEAIEGLQ